jgi:hypothetical protein
LLGRYSPSQDWDNARPLAILLGPCHPYVMETQILNRQMSQQSGPAPTGWERDARVFFRGVAIAAIFWGAVFVAFTHL